MKMDFNNIIEVSKDKIFFLQHLSEEERRRFEKILRELGITWDKAMIVYCG